MTQQALAAQATMLDRPATANADGEPLFYGLTATAWLKVAVVSVLMIATFRFNFSRLWLKTNPFTGEPNWRHSIVVPIVGLYYLYVNRDDLLRMQTYVAWSGLPILLFGILLFGYGIWPGQNDFLKDFGMVIAIFGVVALLCGWQVMKIAWFPIAFLVCAIPWPDLVYSLVASPLQHLAASVAVGTLRLTGVEAQNQGTKILMYGEKGWRALNVAEACAGLRSLMTFISVGAAVAFLSQRPFWQKVLITFSAIPIAIFCNVMRVSGQGLLHRYWSEEWSEGFAHQFAGTVMLIPGFLFILLVGWMLDKLFIEIADERQVKRRTGPTGAAAVVAPTAAAARPVAPPVTKPAAPVAKAAAPVAKPAAPTTKPAAPVAKPAPAVKPPQTNVAVPRAVIRKAPPPPPVPNLQSPAAKPAPPSPKPIAAINKPVAPKPAVPPAPPRPPQNPQQKKEGM